MSVRQYIGARYVPKFVGQWDANTSYESLSIVLYGNSSYTSKAQVPAGIAPTNTEYWAETGNYNGHIDALQKYINDLYSNVSSLGNLLTLRVYGLNSVFSDSIADVSGFLYTFGLVGQLIIFVESSIATGTHTLHINPGFNPNNSSVFACNVPHELAAVLNNDTLDINVAQSLGGTRVISLCYILKTAAPSNLKIKNADNIENRSFLPEFG